jgi:hypothetical protein
MVFSEKFPGLSIASHKLTFFISVSCRGRLSRSSSTCILTGTHAIGHHLKLPGGGPCKIDDAALHKWSPVIDAHDGVLPVFLVGDADNRPEWQGLMRGRKIVLVESIAAAGFLSVETISVIRCFPCSNQVGTLSVDWPMQITATNRKIQVSSNVERRISIQSA